jgi:hypothetical protein
MTDARPLWKWVVLAVATAATLGATLCFRPIHQDPSYHDFADQRALLGIPHALDVLSNLPFLVVGVWGLCNIFASRPARFDAAWERWPWALFMAGVFLTGLGSSYYHYDPRNDTLFWDRLPMTLGFSAFLGIAFIERADARWGARLFAPIVVLGVASLLYGQSTDLRFYFLLQGWAVLLVALLALLFPSRYTGTRELVAALVLYGAAKLFETLDVRIFGIGGIVSGHTLKHLAAGVGAWRLAVMLRKRRPAGAKSDDGPRTAGA